MLDIESIKAEMVPMPGLIEVPRPGGPPALRSAEVDGLVMISRASVDALIAEVERQAVEIEELREAILDYRR